MATVRIKGILTPEGEIKVDLPENWQPGEVEVLIPSNETVWTNEEWEEILQNMKFEGKPIGEIPPELIGAGADWDIGDSAEWVEEQRRKRMEERRKRWTD
jgi:hypothetical protein